MNVPYFSSVLYMSAALFNSHAHACRTSHCNVKGLFVSCCNNCNSRTLHYSSCFASDNSLCCWNTMDKVFGIPSYNELEQEMQWEDNYKRIRILAIFLQVSKFHNIVMTLCDSFNFVHSILVHISRFLRLYIYGYFHGMVYTNNCHTLIIFTTSHFVCGVLRYLEKIIWLKCAIEGR